MDSIPITLMIHIKPFLVLFLFVFCSCAGLRTREGSSSYEKRMRIVNIARAMVGKKEIVINKKKYPYDCSGLVRGVYLNAVGVDLFNLREHPKNKNGVELIFIYFQENGKLYKGSVPDEGDIVFFDKTFDSHGEGSYADRFTHAGIVEKIDNNKTITIIHLNSNGIVRSFMNLKHPHTYIDPKNKKTYNSFTRRSTKKKRGKLTGELFHAFGSLIS